MDFLESCSETFQCDEEFEEFVGWGGGVECEILDRGRGSVFCEEGVERGEIGLKGDGG